MVIRVCHQPAYKKCLFALSDCFLVYVFFCFVFISRLADICCFVLFCFSNFLLIFFLCQFVDQYLDTIFSTGHDSAFWEYLPLLLYLLFLLLLSFNHSWHCLSGSHSRRQKVLLFVPLTFSCCLLYLVFTQYEYTLQLCCQDPADMWHTWLFTKQGLFTWPTADTWNISISPLSIIYSQS